MLDNDILARFLRRSFRRRMDACSIERATSQTVTYLDLPHTSPPRPLPPRPPQNALLNTRSTAPAYTETIERDAHSCDTAHVLYSATVHGLVTRLVTTGLCSAMLGGAPGGGPLGGGGFGEFPCVITETRSSWRLDGGGPSVERADDVVVRAEDVVVRADVVVVRADDMVVVRSDHVGGGGVPAEPPSICRRAE